MQRLGRVDYAEALALQERLHADVAQGRAPDTLLLLEHPPTVTTGRNTGAGHLLWSEAELAQRGVAFCATGRGGDVTFHAPGQLVGYPIVALQPGEQDVRGYVTHLEEALIRTAADFGVVAERVPGLRGIWVGNDKLAAIGVRIARWVTLHGFALNVDMDLGGFDCIVPCGLHGRGVTSLLAQTGRAPALEHVMATVAGHVSAQLRRPLDAGCAVHAGMPHGAMDSARNVRLS